MSCYLRQLGNLIFSFTNELFYKHFHEKLQENDDIEFCPVGNFTVLVLLHSFSFSLIENEFGSYYIVSTCQILSEHLSVICTSGLNCSQLTRRY
ncbi:hypothetical protein T11_13509 [Trichinella zimbabwensis]|uniref:Uncharacterized protein n=1 Tax=Trichinella zimbabwensis TaxID=268475 RepID=A0A0V1HVW2_9BILA|nr:hypothetical protein T11_13509 [Trichinella zimbabwensis]